MCVGALVMGLTTGFDAEAKAKKIRAKRIAKTEKVRVVKATDKVCEKACDEAKAECKDATKACEMKAECKDAKACDNGQMKAERKLLKKDRLGKADKKIKDCDKAKADCKDCEKKGECDHKNPCCKEGACKKDASCGKEKCKANPEACCK